MFKHQKNWKNTTFLTQIQKMDLFGSTVRSVPGKDSRDEAGQVQSSLKSWRGGENQHRHHGGESLLQCACVVVVCVCV